MKILLVAKLTDNSLNTILEPLLQLQDIEQIYVLRDTAGSIKSEKITYVTGNTSSPKSKIRHFNKFKMGIEICMKHKIDFIIGVLIYPHGYIGRMISMFTGLPYIHITIAGHREYWVNGKFIEKINLLLFRRSSVITVTGKKTFDYLVSKGFQPRRVVILPNVISMERYNDFNKERRYDIISLSRIDKNKNISLLLKAMSKLNKSLKTTAIIAGDGPELENIKKEAKLMGIDGNIRFTGWINEQEKNEVYNNAKVFVLCSKGEGFPLALLEAMACGCVPVVTDVGDISDVIVNDLNGFVYNNFNEEDELVSKLESLIRLPDKIKSLSDKAKEIKNKYSLEHVNEAWTNIFKIASNQME